MGIYGVIGYPVAHSMSPLMHNGEFQALHLDHYYTAFNIHPDHLEKAIDSVRTLQINGLNVTIPHKVKVMDYLDEIDEEARLIGAVNTIINQDGHLIGTNTDGEGYLRSLLPVVDSSLKTKKIVLIGAGGAARAIATTLARYGIKELDVANRTLEKADELVKHIHQFANGKALTLKEAEEQLADYDIVINTTSVGMSPHVTEVPIRLDRLKKGAIVSDLIYNPLKTLFLQQAEAKGSIIHNGVGMFVYQGALAFQKWTGIEPNIERMTDTVIKKLGG